MNLQSVTYLNYMKKWKDNVDTMGDDT